MKENSNLVNLTKRILSNHLTLIVMLITLFLIISNSRWTVLAFGTSEAICKILTLILYMILALYILIKIVRDLKLRKSRLSNILCVFLCYCIFIIVVRFIQGGNIKYTIYWTLILVGSISIANIIFDNYRRNKMSLQNIINDFVFFGYVVTVFRIAYIIFLKEFVLFDPINVNIECCIMLVLVPCSILGYLIFGSKKYLIGIILFSICVLYSGSRGGLILWCLEMILICILLVRHKYKVRRMLLLIGLMAIICLLLYAFNIANIQLDLTRAFGGLFNKTSISIDVENQISRSDTGRFELYDLGYKEFIKSPIIGTGEVYFNQTIEGTGEFSQSAHNFVLETLGCFGILGLVQLLLLFGKTFLMMPKFNGAKAYFIVISLCFFGYAMVEPLLYHPLAIITYCIAVLICVIICNDSSIELYSNSHVRTRFKT